MAKRETKKRKCKTCGKEYIGITAFCTLECLHESPIAKGDYQEKRKILDFMLQNTDISARQIAKIFNVSKSVTERLAYFTERKFCKKEVEEDYFENIDTEEKAYWLGFIYADGCISTSNNMKSFSCEICLKESDIGHLYKFRDSISSNIEPKKRISKANGKEYGAVRISVNRKKFYDDLVDKGCMKNKSLKLRFPDEKIFSEKGLIRHFIRGYVDGDGCIGFYKDKHNPSYSPRASLNILGTHHLLKGIYDYFESNGIDIGNGNIYKGTGSKKNIYIIQRTNNIAIGIIDFLYNNSTIYLDRKFEKANEIMISKRYSELNREVKQ